MSRPMSVCTFSARQAARCGIAAILLLSLSAIARATTLTWDPNLSSGANLGGTGTWDNNTTANWYNGASDVTWTDTTGNTDIAAFGGTAGTVTLNNTPIRANGLAFTTTGYTIGASGGTNIVQIGSTTTAVQPTLTTAALSGGSVTFNAPFDLSGVNNNASLAPLITTGNNTITFSGLRNNGVSTLNVAFNGTGNVILNPATSGAFGLSGADATAAWVLSQSTSSRTWILNAGTTPGTNITVNGIITGSIANDNMVRITVQTGGTLTLTSSSSDFKVNTASTSEVQILNNSTLILSAGDGATSATGVLGAQTNKLALGADSSTPSTAATLQFTAPLMFSNPIVVSGNSTTVPITLTTNSDVTLKGTFTNRVSSGQVTMNNSGAGSITLAGGVNLSDNGTNRTLTLAGSAPVIISSAVVDGSTSTAGSLRYNSTTGGSLTLTGTNTYNGATTLSSGTINVNSTTAFGSANSVVAYNGVTIDNTTGSPLTLANNNASTLGGTNIFSGTNDLNLGTGQMSLNGNSRTWTVNAKTLTIGGVIVNGTGTNGLIKNGAGTLQLTSASTYGGRTTVSAGTLQLTGTASAASSSAFRLDGTGLLDVSGLTGGANYNLGTGRFTLSTTAAQTLEGIGGTLSSPVEIPAGDTIGPGDGANSLGTLNTKDTYLTSGTSSHVDEIDLTANNADLLSVTGTFNLQNSPMLTLSFLNLPASPAPGTYMIVKNDGNDPINGTYNPAFNIVGNTGGVLGGFTIDYAFNGTDSMGRVGDGNDIAVSFVPQAVPEPGTFVLFGLGAVALGAVYRRRAG
jgi:autotransporter-associated beta strand protein